VGGSGGGGLGVRGRSSSHAGYQWVGVTAAALVIALLWGVGGWGVNDKYGKLVIYF